MPITLIDVSCTNKVNVDAQQQAAVLKEIHEQVHNNIKAAYKS